MTGSGVVLALREPSPSDWDRWEELLLDGVEPSTAAKECGQTCSSFRRQSTERHAAALTMAREARAHKADELAEEWVTEDGASPHVRTLWLKRWNPAYREKAEISFANDANVLEVRVVHDEQRAIEFARRLVALGVVPGSLVPELPVIDGALVGGDLAAGDGAESAAVDPAPAA